MKSNLFNSIIKAINTIESQKTQEDIEGMKKVKEIFREEGINREETTLHIYLNLTTLLIKKMKAAKTEEAIFETARDFNTAVLDLYIELNEAGITEVETAEEFMSEFYMIAGLIASKEFLSKLDLEQTLGKTKQVDPRVVKEFKTVERQLSNTTYKELLKARKISPEKIIMLTAVKLCVDKIEVVTTKEELVETVYNYLAVLPSIFEEEYDISFAPVERRIIKLINENQDTILLEKKETGIAVKLLKSFESKEDNDQDLFNLTK